jgi:hypothetical protein
MVPLSKDANAGAPRQSMIALGGTPTARESCDQILVQSAFARAVRVKAVQYQRT